MRQRRIDLPGPRVILVAVTIVCYVGFVRIYEAFAELRSGSRRAYPPPDSIHAARPPGKALKR